MDQYLEILKKNWGHESFRPSQREIIESVSNGNDTLALLPTGGGKSICFQLPALLKPGLCLVITPLIALMKDQIEGLKKKKISALCLFSGMSRKEIDVALDRCIYDEIKFLYVSPERLKTELFQERVKQMAVNYIAVDEAHCISQWGYDFRPSYLQIALLREILKAIPVIALTASATPKVADDIQIKLGFKSGKVFRNSFARPNISYSVISSENKEQKLIQILRNVPGSSIVYVRSRRLTEKFAKFLTQNNFNAGAYHAGLPFDAREEIQKQWLYGTLRIIVATNAFGMGIDKPDVRSVIHMDIPENIESYYQEAGRAGRDGSKAYAVLLYYPGDIEQSKKRLEDAYPETSIIQRTYQALANFYQLAEGSNAFASFNFELEEFVEIYQLKKKQTSVVLKLLERDGLILMSDSFYEPSKVYFLVKGAALYEYQVVHEEHDLFIKTLLRFYGGELFVGFIYINESKIAQALNIKTQDVIKKLTNLHTNGILLYQLKKDKPQITFLTSRLSSGKVPFNRALLLERQKIEKSQVEAMVHYTTQHKVCRTILITEYFGEVGCKECGVCDICISARKKLVKFDRNSFELSLIEKLKHSPVYLNDLVNENSNHEIQIVEYVRELMDLQKIELDLLGRLALKLSK